ncbi:DUF1801 domain-containing protein [Photobacterium swingsii]|uniref:DUF1801 domain-containing protein n=1 Tax=Photobacterium swingsii TaxID=680026 RepID=UPI000B1CF7F0|nr:DUF1801 domain-containing protein [Photobacterium swingsii]
MKSEATSVKAYMADLPAERQVVIEQLRHIILDNLPEGFQETMSYGMIGYVVPHSLYPDGYHCSPDLPLPFINIASQKNFIALYHSGIYSSLSYSLGLWTSTLNIVRANWTWERAVFVLRI